MGNIPKTLAVKFLRLMWTNPHTGECAEQTGRLPITIGRAASLNTIRLDDNLVSRQHARLEQVDGQIVIIDQESTNGTFVAGRRIKRLPLNNGDRFQIGPFYFIAARDRPQAKSEPRRGGPSTN